VAPQEIHHHDVVHYALEEVKKEMDEGHETPWSIACAAHLEATRRRKLRRPAANQFSVLSF